MGLETGILCFNAMPKESNMVALPVSGKQEKGKEPLRWEMERGKRGGYLILFMIGGVSICHFTDVLAVLTFVPFGEAYWSDVTGLSTLIAAEVVGNNETDVPHLMFCTAASATTACHI